MYDEHGTEVDGAIVQIESLDMAAPFAISATTSKGAWVAPCVPGGENIQLIATKVGWTRRRRVWADFTQPTIPTIIEFGGDETSAPKPSGGEHFISDRPEVEHVEPAHGAKYVDPGQLRVKLRVSERLPDASRDRLAKAIRVFPLSADAPLPPEDDFSRVRLWSLDEKYPAAIRVGKTAAGDPSIQATSTWNADGTEITLAFDQPLARGATYAIALAAPEAGSILDESGFPLGVGLDGTARATAVPGELLLGAFKEEYLSIEPQRQLIGGDARWQSTHLNATTFTTAP